MDDEKTVIVIGGAGIVTPSREELLELLHNENTEVINAIPDQKHFSDDMFFEKWDLKELRQKESEVKFGIIDTSTPFGKKMNRRK